MEIADNLSGGNLAGTRGGRNPAIRLDSRPMTQADLTRERLVRAARELVAGAVREPAVARLFFVQHHDDLLDDESRKAGRDFRLGLESLIAQGKADGSVKPGAAEVWAGVWLAVLTLAIDHVSAREWP